MGSCSSYSQQLFHQNDLNALRNLKSLRPKSLSKAKMLNMPPKSPMTGLCQAIRKSITTPSVILLGNGLSRNSWNPGFHQYGNSNTEHDHQQSTIKFWATMGYPIFRHTQTNKRIAALSNPSKYLTYHWRCFGGWLQSFQIPERWKLPTSCLCPWLDWIPCICMLYIYTVIYTYYALTLLNVCMCNGCSLWQSPVTNGCSSNDIYIFIYGN